MNTILNTILTIYECVYINSTHILYTILYMCIYRLEHAPPPQPLTDSHRDTHTGKIDSAIYRLIYYISTVRYSYIYMYTT